VITRLLTAAFATSLACASAIAADITATYPAGSITTREQSQRALADMRTARSDAEAEHRQAVQRCSSVFQQTKCTDEAQRKFDARKREISRIELDARDVRRRLDAEERAAKRAESAAHRDGSSPKPLPDEGERAIEQGEKDKAAAENREKFQERQKAHAEEQEQRKQKEAAEAPERAANVKAFEDKQREAAEYAKRKEEERIANEKRRDDRRKERERQQKELEDAAKQQ